MLFTSRGRRASRPHRLIAAGLLLSVFLLPLHVHAFISAAQIAKECSCLHGNRTQLASAPAAEDWAPSPLVSFFSVFEPRESGRFSIGRSAIRAPPSESPL